MKLPYLFLLTLLLHLSGCMSPQRIEPVIDLKAPFTVALDDVALSEAETAELQEILKFWLPKMHTNLYTYPSPGRQLQLSGVDQLGMPCKMTVYVGSNWIGDGTGIVTITDTEAFRLWQIIGVPFIEPTD